MYRPTTGIELRVTSRSDPRVHRGRRDACTYRATYYALLYDHSLSNLSLVVVPRRMTEIGKTDFGRVRLGERRRRIRARRVERVEVEPVEVVQARVLPVHQARTGGIVSEPPPVCFRAASMGPSGNGAAIPTPRAVPRRAANPAGVERIYRRADSVGIVRPLGWE